MDIENLKTTLDKVLIGEKRTLGPENTATGIFKFATDETVNVTDLGLENDIQVDKRVHGGFEKAIHHYPAENYLLLQQALPHLADKLIPATIGENFSSMQLTEKNVCIGDIFRVGSTLLQISQPRMPCWKVNQRYGNAHLSKFIMQQGISGWYYRVLEAGQVQVGNDITLIERLPEAVLICDLWQRFFGHDNAADRRADMQKITGLSTEWLR